MTDKRNIYHVPVRFGRLRLWFLFFGLEQHLVMYVSELDIMLADAQEERTQASGVFSFGAKRQS